MNTVDYSNPSFRRIAETPDFFQSSVLDAFAMASAAVGANRYALLGCVVTTTSTGYSVTAGAVVIDGELCRVDAHTVDTSTPIAGYGTRWGVVQSYASIDPILTPTGTVSIHRLRKAQLQYRSLALPGGGSSTVETSLPTYAQLLSGTLLTSTEAWHIVGASGQPGFGDGAFTNGSPEVQFRKMPSGMVELRGVVHISGLYSHSDLHPARRVSPIGWHHMRYRRDR